MERLAQQLRDYSSRTPRLAPERPERGGRARLRIQLDRPGGLPRRLVETVACAVEALPVGWRVRMLDEPYEAGDVLVCVTPFGTQDTTAREALDEKIQQCLPTTPSHLPAFDTQGGAPARNPAFTDASWLSKVRPAPDEVVLALTPMDPVMAGLRGLDAEETKRTQATKGGAS